MIKLGLHDREVLRLLHTQRTQKLLSNLTDQHLMRRCRKSRTIQAGYEVYTKLITMLLECNYLAKIMPNDGRLYELLHSEEIIDEAMCSIAKALNISVHLATPLFYLIIGWIASELELSDVDSFDIVTCYSVAQTEEGQLAFIIKLIVHMILDKAALRLHAEGCCEEYDRDLQFLLHNGGAGAIYARMKMLIDCGSLLYDRNIETVIMNTLAMELPRLSRSRQIVFTRLLKHVGEGVSRRDTACELTRRYMYDYFIWKMMLSSIIESGIVDLAFDDLELLRTLGRLSNKFNLSRLTRILSQDTRSYVGDSNDLRDNRDLVGALYAMRKNGVHFEVPSTFNFSKGNIGTLLLNKMSF